MTNTFLSVCLKAYLKDQEYITEQTRLAFLGTFGVEPEKVEGKNAFTNTFRLERCRTMNANGCLPSGYEHFKVFWYCPICGVEVDCNITVTSLYSMGKLIMENPPKCTNKKCKGK